MSGIPEDEKLNMETEVICKILIEENFSEIKYTYVYIYLLIYLLKGPTWENCPGITNTDMYSSKTTSYKEKILRASRKAACKSSCQRSSIFKKLKEMKRESGFYIHMSCPLNIMAM